MSDAARSVFINCPFDDDFSPLFEAIIYTVASSGYRIRCALEESDAGDVRFEKLCRLIRESGKSIHDLSRVELGGGGLPRFNMPFEFGLFLGAKRFGGKTHRTKTSLAMIKERYRLPEYLSDAGGSDPECHHGQSLEVVKIVRRYLGVRPDGSQLPGALRIFAEFNGFKLALPALAAELHIAATEIDPIRDYRDYATLLAEFLRRN